MPAIELAFDHSPSALVYMLRGAVPVPRRFALVPSIRARWSGHRVDPARLRSFLDATDLAAGPTLPLLYPHTIGFRLAMAVLTHPAFPVPIWTVLQTRNHLLEHRPLLVDDRLDFDARASAGRLVDKGLEIDLYTTVRVNGVLRWESLVTFFARGRFGPATERSPLAQAPPVDLPFIVEWTMRDDAHWRFGSLTGDYNGIHCWDWYARRFGFRKALYHPPRVLGQCLARLPSMDGPQRLDAWLKGPVPHGARVRLHASASSDGTTFALYGEETRPSVVGRLRRADPGGLAEPHGEEKIQ